MTQCCGLCGYANQARKGRSYTRRCSLLTPPPLPQRHLPPPPPPPRAARLELCGLYVWVGMKYEVSRSVSAAAAAPLLERQPREDRWVPPGERAAQGGEGSAESRGEEPEHRRGTGDVNECFCGVWCGFCFAVSFIVKGCHCGELVRNEVQINDILRVKKVILKWRKRGNTHLPYYRNIT